MASDPSASPARGDAWLSAIVCAGFVTFTAVALGYPATARALPVLVGVFGASLSLLQFFRSVRRLRTTSPERAVLLSPGHRTMFAWFVGAASTVAVLGILAGGALFVVAFLRVRLREPWSAALPAGLALSAVLHLMLERGFGVYLFEGLIWR